MEIECDTSTHSYVPSISHASKKSSKSQWSLPSEQADQELLNREIECAPGGTVTSSPVPEFPELPLISAETIEHFLADLYNKLENLTAQDVYEFCCEMKNAIERFGKDIKE
eukprot:13624299-Ditylum_brightwellii.AAC.1